MIGHCDSPCGQIKNPWSGLSKFTSTLLLQLEKVGSHNLWLLHAFIPGKIQAGIDRCSEMPLLPYHLPESNGLEWLKMVRF